MRLLAKLRARRHRIGPMLIALATVFSFLFVQTAVAASAAAMSSAGGRPHVPCDMADQSMGGASHQVNGPSHRSGKDAEHPCPLMNGAMCLTLTAAGLPQERALPLVRIAAVYVWPADSDILALPAIPLDRPPKNL